MNQIPVCADQLELLAMISEPEKSSSSADAAAETAELLRRLRGLIEKDDRKHWVEIASAILLSIATLCSAWCAYQSTLWGGVQTFRLAAATKAGREAAEAAVMALQAKTFSGTMLIAYLEARNRGDTAMENFLRQRFHPEMKAAFEAWLKTDPFGNPAAPLTPFKMPEYQQPEIEESKRQNELFELEHQRAQIANEASDTYVLLTVLFASVLFFAGIGGTFDSTRLRVGAFMIALILFVATLCVLAGMPICRE